MTTAARADAVPTGPEATPADPAAAAVATSESAPPAPTPADPAPAPPAAGWEELLAAALVGTARRRPPPGALSRSLSLGPDRDPGGAPAGAGPNRRSSGRPSDHEERQLAEEPADPSNRRSSGRPSDHEERQFAEPGREDPAAELLATAAVLAACRRAGARPGQPPRELPAPAGPDDRPPCSDAAVDVLELILSGEVPVPGGVALLAGDWLAGAARAACRPPARLLPRLLDLGSGAAALRPAVETVIGPRGRWLAAHDDRWRWAAADPIEADDDVAAARRFATAPRGERAALLDALRNADPRRGRDVLAAAWPKEPAADRAAFLAQLAIGLSDDDEPFLEAALDDRSTAVRAVAADLLGRLPSSRRARRMADRLRPLVTVGERPGSTAPGGGGLSVTRPPEPDAAARRDGIDDAPPAGMGVGAWRTAQIVAGTPLSVWEERTGLHPADVVDLAAEDSPEILTGLERAAVAQSGRADPAWAVALFRRRPTPVLLAALAPEPAAGELAAALARGLAPRPAVAELLAACPGPWPEPLAEAVLDRYRRLGAQAMAEVPAALPVLAARLDPSALELVEAWAAGLAGEHGLRRRVQTLGHALSLRAVIHQEFPT